MTEIRTAVIGVGYLGKFHAQKYSELKNSKLVAVVDKQFENAQEVASEVGCSAYADYHELLGKVDAVSIVVPTDLHYEVTTEFLKHKTHVLVEKPITTTIEQADKLIILAKTNNLILQVGHLERFNPAILAIEKETSDIRFIESHRLAPYNLRGTEVSVILDLMIHDIDIILDIVDSEVENIEASGTPVLSKDIDIANARIVFKNGCVANVTASRVSNKTERKMRIFQNDAYLSVDFQNRELATYRKGNGEMYPGIPNIDIQKDTFEKSDALMSEIDHFLNCVEKNTTPKVTGQDAKRALQTAIIISELLT
ncbi:MAG: Gfo/Idh/MocA family oxidoreductase [Gammaproteobacteria bacterium]